MTALKAQMAGLSIPEIDAFRHGAGNQKGFARAIADTGAFRVEAIKATSAVEAYTKALEKQDVTFRGWRKNAQLRTDMLKEQYRIQNMSVMAWKEDGRGRISADMIMPHDVPERLGHFGKTLQAVHNHDITFREGLRETQMRMGLWSQGIKSASTNVINWGKNTQWAGRQMMVGLTIPFAALAAGTGALAYQTDKEMTRVLKVYDYATDNIEAEGRRLKEVTQDTANSVARMYGQSAVDTIGIVGELAATGQTGIALQEAAQVVSRASMLGELERQDAIKTTISLQTVFGHSTQELAQDFDYLNSLENATSLSMKDMTIAIPKLSGVVKALGGDLQDMGVIMTATRAAGLEPGEGANMLKTAMIRAVNPFPKGEATFAREVGVDLKALVETANGEVIPTFKLMAEAMEEADLSNQQKVAVLSDVFGVYQASKAGQMLTQMLDLGDATTQVGRAAKVGKEGFTEWADTAELEVRKMQQSASGRFRIAVESLKAQLAELGEPFLEVGIQLVKVIGSMVNAVNALGDTQKKFLIWSLGIGAIVGVVVMVTGVIFTFLGTLAKMGVSLVMLASRYRAVSASEFATNMLAKQSTLAFYDQATAATVLSQQLAAVNTQLTTLAGKAHTARLPVLSGAPGGGVMAAPTIGAPMGPAAPPVISKLDKNNQERFYAQTYNKPEAQGGSIRQQQISAGQAAIFQQAARNDAAAAGAAKTADHTAKLVNSSGKVAENVEKTSRGFSAAAQGVAGTAGMMMVLLGGTNRWVNLLGIALLMLPAILQAVSAIAKLSVFTSMAAGAGSLAGKIKTMAPAVAGIGRSIAGMAAVAMGPLGIALAAAGAAFGVMHYQAKKAREEAENLASASGGVAEAMGVQLLGAGEYRSEDNEVFKGHSGRVKQFVDNNQKAVESMRKLDDEALKERAIKIGLDIYEATGNADKAAEAVQVALDAAQRPDIKIDVNFADENWRDKITGELLDGLVDASSRIRDTDGWLDWGMDERVKVQLEEQADDLAAAFGKFQDGVISSKDLQKEFDRVGDAYAEGGRKIVDRYQENFRGGTKDTIRSFGIDPGDSEAIARALITNDKFYTAMRRGTMDSSNMAEAIKDLRDSYEYLSIDLHDTTGMANRQGTVLGNLTTYTNGLADNTLEAAAATGELGGAASGAVPGVEDLAAGTAAAEEAMKEFVDAQKGMMTSVSNAVFDYAAEGIERSHEATIDNLEAAGEKSLASIEANADDMEDRFEARSDAMQARHKDEDKTFKRSWDGRKQAIKDSYDGRIEAIKNTMDAEKKAEDQRQKMFEAEKARIQRLADMYNQNVDFNVALNTGDLDEAAKISNNMRASEQQWALDAAAASGEDAVAARREGQEKEIERIGNEKDARLQAINEEEERAKETLQARQDREKKALADEKERYNDSVQAAKKAAQEKTKAAVDSARKEYEARKRALDMELAALKAFVPKNQAELNQHIGRIEEAYGRHGFKLNTKSAEWSNYVARAMKSATDTAVAELTNAAKWDAIGKDMGDELAQGMLGMTFPQFITWMNTGQLPASNVPTSRGPASPRQADRASTVAINQREADRAAIESRDRRLIRHGGGPIGSGNYNDRAGRPMNAKLYPDEVPVIAQKGEFMMQRDAVKRIGVNNLMALNQGAAAMDAEGKMHQGGLVGAVGGMAAAFLKKGVEKAMYAGAQRKASEGAPITPKLMATLTAKGDQSSALAALTGGTFGRGGSWPPRVFRRASSNTLAAKAAIDQMFPMSNRGGDLSLGRQDVGSDHAWGKALDIFMGNKLGQYATGASLAEGNQIAQWLVNNPEKFGTKYVIWQNKINKGRGWEPYNRYGPNPGPTLGHYDHVHASFRHAGGPIESSMTKGLKSGGITLNDGYAKLHRKEAVLTAPLTESLHRGIENLDRGVANQYTLTVDLRGAMVREEVDIERAVEKVINAKESRMGRKRVIG